MERLTEMHFKKADGFYMKCSGHCCKEDFSCEDCGEFEKLVDRLGQIEDILGDIYDLDRLRELVEADKSGRCTIISTPERIMFYENLEHDIDPDRLRELVEADKDGRCFVRPDFVFRIGETRGIIKVLYKPWMDRFMGTKFYKSEKEAAEAALAKEAK